ncbi:MAG: hypothetical protein K0U66_08320 [Gammaproteobacteria bacterium]|nr:hypothetical protein [Gammaproteobacteria bacterium]
MRQHCLEASGNIDISSILAYATVGLGYISAGALTKNVEAADFSLRLDALSPRAPQLRQNLRRRWWCGGSRLQIWRVH